MRLEKLNGQINHKVMRKRIKGIIKKLARFGYKVEPKNTLVDPVCGMEATSGMPSLTFEGRDYHFCSEHCRKQFEAHPNEFVKKQ